MGSGPNCGSLQSGGNTACDNPCGVATINQGQDTALTVSLISQATGFPFDLTSVVSILASFLNADNTTLELSLPGSSQPNPGQVTISSAAGGVILISLTAVQTQALQAASGNGFGSFIVTIVLGGKTFVVNFFNSIQIVPPPFTP
jgi:hypothetical protein